MVLSSAPLMRLTLTSAFHPVVITAYGVILLFVKMDPVHEEDLVHLMQITIIPTFPPDPSRIIGPLYCMIIVVIT